MICCVTDSWSRAISCCFDMRSNMKNFSFNSVSIQYWNTWNMGICGIRKVISFVCCHLLGAA